MSLPFKSVYEELSALAGDQDWRGEDTFEVSIPDDRKDKKALDDLDIDCESESEEEDDEEEWYKTNENVKNYWTDDDGKLIIVMRGECEKCGDYIEYNYDTSEVCGGCEEEENKETK
jgi:hypothetical protein